MEKSKWLRIGERGILFLSIFIRHNAVKKFAMIANRHRKFFRAFDIDEYSTVQDILDVVEKGKICDIAFLDICLPEI